MERKRILRTGVVAAIATILLIFQNCSQGKRMATTASDQASTNSNEFNQLLQVAATNSSTPQEQAILLYQRLSGVTLNIDDPLIQEMSRYISNGQPKRAAQVPLTSKEFYSLTVRDFAASMSTRETSPAAPLSDFVATIIGAVRDDVPATQLLTGNFYYRTKNIPGVSDNIRDDIIRSNVHYEQMDSLNVDLKQNLIREEGQKVLDSSGGISTLDDAAGLLTTRAWMMAHANAGTNRRIIEYSFKVFLCSPIKEWANTTYPDSHVGREVGRFPNSEYRSKCKACHTGMDGMRPATAYFDFKIEDAANNTGFIKYKYSYAKDPSPTDPSQLTVDVPSDQQLIPSKFRRASSTFPLGYIVKNTEWVNYTSTSMFGWKSGSSPNYGSGMNQFGQMIASSRGYSQCLVRKVFSTVCKRDLTSADNVLINKLAVDFENNNYNMKDLFTDIAIRPECLSMESL